MYECKDFDWSMDNLSGNTLKKSGSFPQEPPCQKVHSYDDSCDYLVPAAKWV